MSPLLDAIVNESWQTFDPTAEVAAITIAAGSVLDVEGTLPEE